jgi:AcrR family transcriptional regulator
MKVRPKKKNKHQLRTEETQAKILDAAEVVFSEQGFENTQLEAVATRAGYTRGAIYAHYSDKEDLFLALMQHRVLTQLTALLQVIEAEVHLSKRPEIFKRWIVSQASDRNWCTLVLEFKMYALRRPRSREKLLNMYDTMCRLSGGDFVGKLFGDKLDRASRAAVERRLAVISAILGAVVLESHLRPKLFSNAQLQLALKDLFDALIGA